MTPDVIKNAIDLHCLLGARAAVPDLTWPHWHRYSGTADKYATVDASRIPAAVMRAINQMADRLERFLPTGSFWDMDLHGAGIHVLPAGGFLGRHLDAARHPIRPWIRTTSAVLFLNALEGSEAGGELVLEQSEVRVTPEANTAVVFDTESEWHWVEKTAVTAGPRITLALFGWRTALPYESETGRSLKATFVERPITAPFGKDGASVEF